MCIAFSFFFFSNKGNRPLGRLKIIPLSHLITLSTSHVSLRPKYLLAVKYFIRIFVANICLNLKLKRPLL